MTYDYQYVKFSSPVSISLPDGSEVNEFILSTQQPDLGYGSADRAILNKGLTIGDIRYQINKSGLQQVQNTSVSFSNVDQFYEQMRELNSLNFWSTLSVEIFWASGRVPSLAFDGVNWLADGVDIVAFTPSETYPLTNDYIKKEFEGVVSNPSTSKDKVSIALVSKSKQDSYLVGSIQSFNGADSSRSLISPIVLGDLTDENAFIPLILKNAITSKSTAICSDVTLLDAPTPFIYDDENEKFHEVINDQKAINDNKQIEFYNEDESKSVETSSDFIKTDKSDGSNIYSLETGEVVGYFTDTEDYTIISDYTDPSNYEITDTTSKFRDEGNRDNSGDGIYGNGTDTGFLVDADMAVGIAKLNLSLYPINIREITPVGTDINTPSEGDLSGYYAFEQDPLGPNDFNVSDGSIVDSEPSVFGQYKNFVNYRGETNRVDHETPTFDSSTDSLWFSGLTRGNGLLSSSWPYYNYVNKLRYTIQSDFNQFKYDSDIIDLDFSFFGGVYKDHESSTDTEAFDASGLSGDPAKSLVSLNCSSTEIGDIEKIIHNDSSVNTNVFLLNDSLDIPYTKLSEIYENPPSVTFNGFSYYNPVKSSDPSENPPIPANCFLDRVDPSFFGSSRFVVDGVKIDATVNAKIESKYWCFKGRTGEDVFLLDGLTTLSDRYENTSFTSRDSAREDWQMGGAHIGDPIYYRDLVSKISDEFRVFITDKNNASEIVSMGLDIEPIFTIDESNTFTPWNSSVSLSETSSSEMYTKIVLRYAKNHMTGKFGKTVSMGVGEVQKTTGIPRFDNQSQLQAYFALAANTLSRIGISEKVKTIDLDWVRDDYTANNILEWWCVNSYKQRAKIKADVSKLKLMDIQIGDVVDVDLPSLPTFYQKNYQVTKIVNKSDKKYQLELEEFEAVEIPPQGVEIGGRFYSTVEIGSLEWMSENLAFESGIYQYPNNDIAYADDWGLLYPHGLAVSLAPEGWRLPTEADFDALILATGFDALDVGKELKVNDVNQWSNDTHRGLDSFGFSAQSAGFVGGNVLGVGTIQQAVGTTNRYWTSTFLSEFIPGINYYRIIELVNAGSYMGYGQELDVTNSGQRNLSVRYVRDI